MAYTYQKVYVSASSHIAVDNFASRIDMLDRMIVKRYNESLPEHQSPMCRKLIIRGFPIKDEIKALRNLLEQPEDGDSAAANMAFRGVTKWKLHLSAAYWVLKALGSLAVPALGAEDSPYLHNLRGNLETHPVYSSLVDVARGNLSWSEYKGHASNSTDNLTALFEMLISETDLVCTTPTLSEKALITSGRLLRLRALLLTRQAI
jgi:hypothetical protein